jgi:hypothetical protein
MGFIEGEELTFDSKSNSEDCHHEMSNAYMQCLGWKKKGSGMVL